METKDEVRLQNTSILSDGYGLIPRSITRNKSISLEAKAIYAYLASFAGAGGTCFPGKELMLSELCISENRFNKNIKQLKEFGYIKVHRRRRGNRRDTNLYELLIDTRDIEEARKCFETIQFEGVQNEGIQNEGIQSEGIQIAPPNINSLNSNSINNNSSKNSKYIDKENLSNKLKEFRILYEQNIGLINGVSAEWLIEMSETIDIKLFKRAIEIATDRNKCNPGYVKGIIKQWLDINIKTYEELKAYELQKKNQKEVKSDVRGGKGVTETESSTNDREDEEARRAELLRQIQELED